MRWNRLSDKVRKALHPLLLKTVKGKINLQVKLLNSMPEVRGNKIFAVNHSCVLDAPVSSVVIKDHFYFLVGKQSLEIIDRIFFFLNGVIYVDRKDKESKKNSVQKMLKILREGESLLMFPEGTWNLTPNKPIIPLYWGIVDLARQTGVPIIPLILEYDTDCCYVKFGEPIYIDDASSKTEEIQRLEASMSTLKWDIWEFLPIVKRSDDMQARFETMIQKRLTAYPKFDLAYEMSIVRKSQM